MTTIKQWSHSKKGVFDTCKFRAKLQYVDKIPEPERPLPPGKTEHANDRGTRIHDAAELFVKDNVRLISELDDFSDEMHKLKELFQKGMVSLEGEWAHDNQWDPVAWASEAAWLRLKLDAFVRVDKNTGLVIDYKSGRMHGNEIKHAEQGQLYMVSVFVRYPEIETVVVEFWYIDQDDITSVTYTRKQSEHFLRKFTKAGDEITSCTDFPPNPNIFSCKWCPYGPKGTGHCTVGV
jgi:hypothetical protein